MNISINSVRFKTDQKLEKFIVDKLQKIEKLHDNILGSEVTLKVENTDKPENKIADIRLKIKGHDLHASKQCKTFEEATDQAVEVLKRQLKKTKTKQTVGKRKTVPALKQDENHLEHDEEI